MLCYTPNLDVQGAAPAGVALADALWPPDHRTVTVAFLGGNEGMRAVVRRVVDCGWNRVCGLQFVWVDGPADLRVAFVPGSNWSFVGRYNLDIPQDRPTMNLGALIDGTILHEFGHALGLMHEQAHPGAEIPWDYAAVYNHYTDMGWTREEVERNVFARFAWGDVAANTYDAASVMHYYIPPEFVCDRVARGGAGQLSAGDVALVRRLYGAPREVYLPIGRGD